MSRFLSSRRAAVTLTAFAAVLVVALFVAPARLAAIGSDADLVDPQHLADAFRAGFVAYWNSGEQEFPPELARVVDFWFRFHVIKAVVAACLLVVVVLLGRFVWKRVLPRVVLGALALLALVIVMANIQGAVAPFSSLLPTLVGGPDDPALDQVRQSLSAGDLSSPVLRVMIADNERYHVALAVVAAVVAVLLVGLSARAWTRFAGRAGSDRRLWALSGVLSGLLSVLVIVVAIANATTAADSAPSLLALFQGGN